MKFKFDENDVSKFSVTIYDTWLFPSPEQTPSSTHNNGPLLNSYREQFNSRNKNKLKHNIQSKFWKVRENCVFDIHCVVGHVKLISEDKFGFLLNINKDDPFDTFSVEYSIHDREMTFRSNLNKTVGDRFSLGKFASMVNLFVYLFEIETFDVGVCEDWYTSPYSIWPLTGARENNFKPGEIVWFNSSHNLNKSSIDISCDEFGVPTYIFNRVNFSVVSSVPPGIMHNVDIDNNIALLKYKKYMQTPTADNVMSARDAISDHVNNLIWSIDDNFHKPDNRQNIYLIYPITKNLFIITAVPKKSPTFALAFDIPTQSLVYMRHPDCRESVSEMRNKITDVWKHFKISLKLK